MVFVEAFLFVATGVLSTIVGQLLLFSGSGDSWTMLIPLSNYLGMALVSIIPERFALLANNSSSSTTTNSGVSPSSSSSSITTTTTENKQQTTENQKDTIDILTPSSSSTNNQGGIDTLMNDYGNITNSITHPRHRTTTTATTSGHPNTTNTNTSTGIGINSGGSNGNSLPGTPLRSLGGVNTNGSTSSIVVTPSHRGSPTLPPSLGGGGGGNPSNGIGSSTIFTNNYNNNHYTNYTDNHHPSSHTDIHGTTSTDNDIDILKKQQHISLFHQHPVSFFRSLHQKLLSLSSSSSTTSIPPSETSSSASSAPDYYPSSASRETVSSVSINSSSMDHPSSSVHNSNYNGTNSSSSSSSNGKLCGIVPRPFTITTNQYVCSVIILDIMGYYFHVLGLRYAGSALFQVVYSSVVIWAAILSRLLRGKQQNNQLNTYQIFGIGIVLFGLVYSTVAEHVVQSGTSTGWLAFFFPSTSRSDFAVAASSITSSSTHNNGGGLSGHHEGTATIDIEGIGNDKEDTSSSLTTLASPAVITNPDKQWDIIIGMVFSLLSSLTYGTVYALAEVLMMQPNPPNPKFVAKYIGFGISIVLFLYVFVFTLPRYNDILLHVQELSFLSWSMIIVCYITMMLSAAVHSITYYQLMYSLGAIAAGIMQSARAIGVFIIAGIFFCSYQESQCFSYSRGIATLFVIGGILFYSYGKQLHQSTHK